MANYCQECGSSMSPQHVDGRMRAVCTKCGRIEYLQWKVSAGVRIVKDGKLLLVKRGHAPWQGKWHMPAGYVEVDEEPARAAEREAYEETGLVVESGKLVDCYLDTGDPRGNVLVLLYDARILDGNPVPCAETESIGFFSPEEIPSLELAGESSAKEISDWISSMHIAHD